MNVAAIVDWYTSTSELNRGMLWAHLASTAVGAVLLLYEWAFNWYVDHTPRDRWPSFVERDVNGPEGHGAVLVAGVLLLVPAVGPMCLGLGVCSAVLLGLLEIAEWVCDKLGIDPRWTYF